jgi:hypothetical protein
MSLPRRRFLRDVLRSTLSVGLLLAGTRAGFAQKSSNQSIDSAVPLEAQRDPVFLFEASTFEPYVGDIFQVRKTHDVAVELKLVKVQKYQATNRLTKRARSVNTFLLLFQASDELPTYTPIHTITHPALGSFGLFLTHRKSEQGELFYEAVISHVR